MLVRVLLSFQLDPYAASAWTLKLLPCMHNLMSQVPGASACHGFPNLCMMMPVQQCWILPSLWVPNSRAQWQCHQKWTAQQEKEIQLMIDLPSSRQSCQPQQCDFAALFLANTHTHDELSFEFWHPERRRACAFDSICSTGSIGRDHHHCCNGSEESKKKKENRDRLQELLCLCALPSRRWTPSKVKKAREKVCLVTITCLWCYKLRVSRSARPLGCSAELSCIQSRATKSHSIFLGYSTPKKKANDIDANLF